jgi:hypothetical protein
MASLAAVPSALEEGAPGSDIPARPAQDRHWVYTPSQRIVSAPGTMVLPRRAARADSHPCREAGLAAGRSCTVKTALISPKGPLYRHRGGIFKQSLRSPAVS